MADGGDGQILPFPRVEIAESLDDTNEGNAFLETAAKGLGSFDFTSTPSPAAQILSKAAELIDGERNVQHGDRKACHTQIARLWSAFLGVQVTAVDAALMLALLKIARMQTGSGNGDNFVDGSAYIALAGELANHVSRP